MDCRPLAAKTSPEASSPDSAWRDAPEGAGTFSKTMSIFDARASKSSFAASTPPEREMAPVPAS